VSEAADLVAVDVGASHTEVELVLVNCESVGFERELAEGDRVAVYPEFEDARSWAASRARRGRSCAA